MTFDDYHGDRNPHQEAKAIFGKTNRQGSSCSIYDHEPFPSLTETAFGSHPCRVVSVTYRKLRPFHGDAKDEQDQSKLGLAAKGCAESFAIRPPWISLHNSCTDGPKQGHFAQLSVQFPKRNSLIPNTRRVESGNC